MVLTPAGERLRESAATILAAIRRAQADALGVAAEREQILRFSTECYTCYHWLPGALREFQRRFPKVEPRIVADVTRRPLPALLKGQLDLAIVHSPVRDRRLAVTPLFTDEMVAVVPPGHPWAARRFVTADDFADEHFLSYTMSRAESTLFQEVLLPAGVIPRQVSQVELTEAIIELVKAGLGIGVLARWAVAPHVRAGTLATARITEQGIQRAWSAAVVRRKVLPEHVRAFIAVLSRSVVGKDAPLRLIG
jgi:LysR family transcriptional regulator for metE and metH